MVAIKVWRAATRASRLVLPYDRTASLIRVLRPGLATAQGLQASMAASFVIKARMHKLIPVTMAGAVKEFSFLAQ